MGSFRFNQWFRVLGILLLVLGTVGCASGSEEKSSDAVSVGLAMTGSVGDGPIVGATITLLDANGEQISSTTSDAAANYQINVPDGAPLPITVIASGGIDLVTGRAPDFDLVALVGVGGGAGSEAGTLTINVSPLTTLVVRTAQCAGTVLDEAALATSLATLQTELGMGLDSALVGNPMTDTVSAANAPAIVLTNEALGEALRRTEAALSSSGSAIDADAILGQLACDLADGALDGQGDGVDPRAMATFRAAEALVLLEVASGRLEVDGQDATSLMNQALAIILPDASAPNVLDVAVTGGLLDQAARSLALLQGAYSDPALVELLAILESATPQTARAGLNAALDASVQTDLASLAERVALADDSLVQELALRMQAQTIASAPIIALSARDAEVTSGTGTVLSWAASEADQCSAAGGWQGPMPVEGNYETAALVEATAYELTCFGVGGTTKRTVQVTVAASGAPPPATEPPPAPQPSVSLRSSDSLIDGGGTATLTWTSSDADSCLASGGWSGGKAISGSQTVGPLNSSTTFGLSCTGAGGNAIAMITVEVTGLISLSWVAPTENVDGSALTDLAGYRIYYGEQSRNYLDPVTVSDPATTSKSIAVLGGSYFVAMTSVDADGNESAYSNEVVKTTN